MADVMAPPSWISVTTTRATPALLMASGYVWSAAFALFVLAYGPILLRRGVARI